MKKEQWEIDRQKADKRRTDGMSLLTKEQLKTLDETYEAINDFLNDYTDMFDVSSETARKLQIAFWGLRHEFKKENKEE
jgi:hypothetical protein